MFRVIVIINKNKSKGTESIGGQCQTQESGKDSEDVTFGGEVKKSDGMSHEIIWEKSIPDTEDNKCV